MIVQGLYRGGNTSYVLASACVTWLWHVSLFPKILERVPIENMHERVQNIDLWHLPAPWGHNLCPTTDVETLSFCLSVCLLLVGKQPHSTPHFIPISQYLQLMSARHSTKPNPHSIIAPHHTAPTQTNSLFFLQQLL